MIAIVGLGNIGKNYENTYHNMGFMVIDAFAKKHGITFNKNKFSGTVGEGQINGEKVVLLKPSTFMNASGESVVKLVNMHKLNPQNLLVVYDDVDLPLGALRIRANGSAGTHNGMKNILLRLNTSEFPRLRVGIGRDDNMDLADYVLSHISKQNMDVLNKTFDKAVQAIECFINNNCDVTKVIINN